VTLLDTSVAYARQYLGSQNVSIEVLEVAYKIASERGAKSLMALFLAKINKSPDKGWVDRHPRVSLSLAKGVADTGVDDKQLDYLSPADVIELLNAALDYAYIHPGYSNLTIQDLGREIVRQKKIAKKIEKRNHKTAVGA